MRRVVMAVGNDEWVEGEKEKKWDGGETMVRRWVYGTVAAVLRRGWRAGRLVDWREKQSAS